MRSLKSAASALEESLQDLLALFHAESPAPEVVASLRDRCALLTTQLVEATVSSTPGEIEGAATVLRRAQRLNVIARGAVERQRETAGTLITSTQRARRALGVDAPVKDGVSCDVKA